MSGHVDGPRAVSDLNEQAVEAAAAKIKRFGWPYVENATAVVKQMIPAYFDSLAEQGIVLVEQPTKPCEKCGGSGRYRDVRYWGTMPGSTSCDDCNGSGTVPVVLVDVQEVAEALRHADYPLAPTTLNAAADFILRRFAPEPTSCAHDWTDARNKVVESGEVCLRCGAIRAGNTPESERG